MNTCKRIDGTEKMYYPVAATANVTCIMLSLMLLLVPAIQGRAAENTASEKHRTDWFHKAKWGVFSHYMFGVTAVRNSMTEEEFQKDVDKQPVFHMDKDRMKRMQELQDSPGGVELWNKLVDGCDVEGLAKQLEEVGAGYFVITIGQNSGYWCSPNAAYDSYVGRCPSRCSRRDLIADLYDALHPRGIKLMVYASAHGPYRDPVAAKALDVLLPPKYASTEMQIKWHKVIHKWSMRWGNKVEGWWFDGATYMHKHKLPPHFESLAAAARAGNPDSIVAFSTAMNAVKASEHEDYTSGESSSPRPCSGRWLNGLQYHVLSYLGRWWSWDYKPRWSDKTVIQNTRAVTDKGGVITWDIPLQVNGLISKPFYDQLKALNEGMKKQK